MRSRLFQIVVGGRGPAVGTGTVKATTARSAGKSGRRSPTEVCRLTSNSPLPFLAGELSREGASVDSTLEVAWSTGSVLFFATAWMAIGFAAAVILGWRGHEFRPNAALGIAMGPMFLLLAYDSIRHAEPKLVLEVKETPRRRGTSILVIIVGAVADSGRVSRFVTDLDADPGSVTVGVVAEFDLALHLEERGLGALPSSLKSVASALAGFDPGQVVLPGRAARAVSLGIDAIPADLVVLAGSKATSTVRQIGHIVDLSSVYVTPSSAAA